MRAIALTLLLGVAACARGHVTTDQGAFSGQLPPPSQVVVTDFAINPQDVRLDQGVGPQILRASSSQTAPDQVIEIARATQAALTETLLKRLNGYGLAATRLPAGVAPPAEGLLVQGQILAVDEGNRTRRVLIGLGAGKSSVSANAQIYYAADPARPLFLASFVGEADSGRAPGAAETMGASAAAGSVATAAALTAGTHGYAELKRTGDEANADRLADALAKQIGTYAVSRGWIQAAALK